MDKTVESAVEHLAERVSLCTLADRLQRSAVGGIGPSNAMYRSERTEEEPEHTSDRDTERQHPGSTDTAVAQAWFWGR